MASIVAEGEPLPDATPGSASPTNQVVLRGLTKRYGEVVAVDHVDLDVEAGELIALLGPSGCGKSTVLRMLAGLEEPTDGSIEIAGRVVDDVEAKDRDVAMVFQSYALYPHMTVRRNVEFPLLSRKTPRHERDAAVAEASRALGLDDLLDRKPAQLSGGQRQRVALARAIVRRPQVFLMDEPLSNLDAKLRVETRIELIELHRRLRATIVYVTHDQVEAMTMGSRIAIMNRGVLQQVGPPQDVYERPANLFVARFIGSPPMNTVTGTVTKGGAAIELPGGRLPLSATLRTTSAGDLGDVVVGLRPEALSIAPANAGGNGLAAEVLVVESLGHERHVLCRLGPDQVVTVRQPADAPRPEERTVVSLVVDPVQVHLFDAGDGGRIA